MEAKDDCFLARLDWDRMELLALFPFPHHVQIEGRVTSNLLTLKTMILADAGSAVPISFGFHPYFGIPHLPRAQWRLQTPAMQKLQLDSRGIPTVATENFDSFDGLLADHNFDDGFALPNASSSFALSGGGYNITVDFLEGYSYSQIFAPKGRDFIAIEPMTAPTNALSSGKGLRILEKGHQFQASFCVNVDRSGN
jgi:aldose 1-epimerase